MEQGQRICAAIDLKSFYASVECVERGLDPLTTNLVVADESRTDKTICLAVTPPLKAMGVPGRPRLFEVVQKVKEINSIRKFKAGQCWTGEESTDAAAINANPNLAVGYIVATPRMAKYLEYSARIYQIYLHFVSAEDVHVYSVDEVFIDLTPYFSTVYRGKTAHELVREMIAAVLSETGITATAGIGTNLYLAKIAMDIVAKKMPPDRDGVRIAELDEKSYRRLLWTHRPLTDFWRIGHGYAKRLEAQRLFTMGDIARCSLGNPRSIYNNERSFFRQFGINAELLIDHAWGRETCTIADIKAYRPKTRSISNGQVLQRPYNFNDAEIIVREMAESIAYQLTDKALHTGQITLAISYDVSNLADAELASSYQGEIVIDHYGRRKPKSAHGSINLPSRTNSARLIAEETTKLFGQIANHDLLVRKITICAERISSSEEDEERELDEGISLFAEAEANADEAVRIRKDENIQRAVLNVRYRYGRNSIFKATSLLAQSTAMQRNREIGGHRA